MQNNIQTDVRYTLPNILDLAFSGNSNLRISAEVFTTNPNFPKIYGDCTIDRSFLSQGNVNSRLLNKIKQEARNSDGYIFYVGTQWAVNARRVPVFVSEGSVVGLKISGVNGSAL